MTKRTPEAIAAMRAYADDLRAAGAAYQQAANAAGMDRLKGRREAADYLTSEGQRLIRESRSVDQIADEWEAADAAPLHTIGGQPIGPDNPGQYGRTHDMECPGCADTPFTASPRSETYWAS